ncbi:hypothetical protein M409DRAFT_59511 [Zasmidium cellare ATCC 36951]|uniref:Enoyl reductase (ER) domain-containing protein n=1 Tax=Zasmidium cellare ATCC 36951 TaxID=1080233 RepID=A0A6A6C1Q7_ZASCE|nr:uncharacterized protein M409DRAFT_59511 [Zasmidium cellare ATCC 36951]KAF2160987.1 hypothetical protein M409DRAFT_59511 [Zasmidium cellare ATCC 36951]
MYQAQIDTWGAAPKYIQVPDLPQPTADEVQIKVSAVGIHNVVRSRASGKHYSSGSLPHIPGIDGVGHRTTDNKLVYFWTFGTGVLREYVNLPKTSVYELPDETDPVQLASSINPAMSSWMTFKGRTKDLPKDFTVLILGATSASGRIAISIARSLGAKKVIGAARSQASLDTLPLDEKILIPENVSETDFTHLDDVDGVLDYIYGPLALHLFSSLKTPKPVQYVHIGAVSGVQEINLPGALLRSKDITIRGSGPGSWQMGDFARSLPELLGIVSRLKEKGPVKVVRMEDVEAEWGFKGKERLVFVP